MKMWSSQLQLRFKQSQSKPKKCFQGFNGIRTHGLYVSAAVPHQLSYKDPYHTLAAGQFIEFIVYVKGLKYNTMCKLQTYQWNEDELKWNEANAEAMGSNPVEAPKTFFGFTLRLLKSQLQLQWSHLHFIRMSAVHIIFIYFTPFMGTMNSINWPAPNVWVFIAQLVEHCSANAEAMGLNPTEAPKTFFGLTLQVLKSQLQLRWSHLHFINVLHT